jgi:hypothetical protein
MLRPNRQTPPPSYQSGLAMFDLPIHLTVAYPNLSTGLAPKQIDDVGVVAHQSAAGDDRAVL